MKMHKYASLALVCVLLLGGCRSTADTQAGTAASLTAADTAATVAVPTCPHTHHGSESFSVTIRLEGMEEQVNAQHYHDDDKGFCIDYHCDDFLLTQEEAAIALAPQLSGPEIAYVRIYATALMTQQQQDALAARQKALQPGEASVVELAGADAQCLCFHTGSGTLCYYYVGTELIVETYCITEALEGFGSRIAFMLQTLSLL